MDTPFKLSFMQFQYQEGDREIPISNFVLNERELYQMNVDIVPEVMENKQLLLRFTSNDENARLYMDGLDTISIRDLEFGEDDLAYLPPSEEAFVLYDTQQNSRNSNGYYPFIPGYYRIKVVVKEVSYYSWLKVQPKQITEEQWVTMRDEVEEALSGLAQDLIRKNASLGVNSSLPIPIHILRKLYIIKKDYQKWITALKSIQLDPRMRIRKEYNLVPQGKAGEIDATTILYRSRHPESREFLYKPSNKRNYNLVENQWIQKISKFIVRETSYLLEYLEKHEEKVRQEIQRLKQFHHHEHVQIRLKLKVVDELKEYERFVRHVRSECLAVLKTEWMTEVEETYLLSIPHVLHLDTRYRQLYQLYRLLKNEEISITMDSNYDYYWKRTDLLYEIWGFLRLIQGLQHELVGFKVEKGWIFSMNSNSKAIQVPFLEPGTVIEFKKEKLKLCLVYDETLPFRKEETNLYKPIYANDTHNRPDVRMDLYEENEYIGSIMIDFKYRPLRFIWDDSKLRGTRQTDAMRQLISYRSNMESPFLYNIKFPGRWHRFKTVHEVWAVYPKNEANIQPKDPMGSHLVRLMELTPMEENENFFHGLADAIQKVVDEYSGITQSV